VRISIIAGMTGVFGRRLPLDVLHVIRSRARRVGRDSGGTPGQFQPCEALPVADSSLIEAAGAVLWRSADRGVEIAVIHRPRYDDWSLPKGKLLPDEQPFAAALREVAEETGSTGPLGRHLGEIRYRVNGDLKRVRYWSVQHAEGTFCPGDEVDIVEWLPPRSARRRMSFPHDLPVLDHFLSWPAASWPLLIVRHSSAGRRSAWKGEDAERPLDKRGQRQAEALAGLLCAYRPTQIITANVERCRQTVRPVVLASGLPLGEEPLFSEDGYRAEPTAAIQRLLGLAATGAATVVCSQGKSIPGLLEGLCGELDGTVRGDPAIPKGGLWLVHLAWRADRFPDIVSWERVTPLA
jgi:8-oxo-(d)GTP phosphatase